MFYHRLLEITKPLRETGDFNFSLSDALPSCHSKRVRGCSRHVGPEGSCLSWAAIPPCCVFVAFLKDKSSVPLRGSSHLTLNRASKFGRSTCSSRLPFLGPSTLAQIHLPAQHLASRQNPHTQHDEPNVARGSECPNTAKVRVPEDFGLFQ